MNRRQFVIASSGATVAQLLFQNAQAQPQDSKIFSIEEKDLGQKTGAWLNARRKEFGQKSLQFSYEVTREASMRANMMIQNQLRPFSISEFGDDDDNMDILLFDTNAFSESIKILQSNKNIMAQIVDARHKSFGAVRASDGINSAFVISLRS